MLLKSMVLWMLMHTLLSSVNNICRNMKIGETQNFASLFCCILCFFEKYFVIWKKGIIFALEIYKNR